MGRPSGRLSRLSHEDAVPGISSPTAWEDRAMTAAAELELDDDLEPVETEKRIPWVFAIWLIVAGVIGEIAAFALTIEKFHALAKRGVPASCDISVFVQCTKNLDSWQGAVFGFPNPIIGLVCWMAPIVVG